MTSFPFSVVIALELVSVKDEMETMAYSWIIPL